ncbi:MAG: prolipoprotein diacylglyceryl transferase [Candidatus Latescibacteria bacterium]|jgi:prolipoprotein diacylglyceryl transferase|nr:prolipoprotein diacylglyceryl transferase [Candidatus Latescibacterota bacterium]
MIHWNVTPELFSVGPLTVRWYGLFFVLTFLFGFLVLRWMFRSEGRPEGEADQLLNYMVLGTVVGARLGHCLLYDPAYYLSHPIEIVMVWKGGLASHGAAAGILVALYIYSRGRSDSSCLWVLDRVAVPSMIAGFCVRMGNLFNSEIIGTPTDLPWAFVFERVDSVPRHPTQLYEAIAYGIVFFLLLTVYRRSVGDVAPGRLIGLLLVTVFTFRFAIETVKVRQAAYGHDMALTVGQLLSIPLVVGGAWLLARSFGRDHPRASERG